MRTLPWLSLSTLLVLASTGCPAADDSGQGTDGSSSSSTGDDSNSTTATTASTTVSTSDSTSASTTVSTTDSTTDSTTVSTTDTTESGGTTDPDTSGGESSTAESGGSSSGGSGGSDSTGNDTGMGDCKPSGDACEDCYVVDNCCAAFTACFEDADCTCILTCVGGGMDVKYCFGDGEGACNLNQSPEPFDLLVECLNDADAECAAVCG